MRVNHSGWSTETTLVNAKHRWSIQLHFQRSKGKNAFKGSVEWNQWHESKNLQDQVSDHCDRMSYTVFTDEAMSYWVINWSTEIIEMDNELLVLKIEQIDWLNYVGKMGILLQHLRMAYSSLSHSACITEIVIFNKRIHRDTKVAMRKTNQTSTSKSHIKQPRF